jgi:hypothetical protein
MKILVCGSRYWDDEEIIFNVLDGYICNLRVDLTIIDGCANGADDIGHKWTQRYIHGREDDPVKCERYPADWETYGKRAGYLRNVQMLEEGHPDLVLAFTDNLSESKGTAMMVKLAKDAGIPVYVIGRG